jgi:hypothetical protein
MKRVNIDFVTSGLGAHAVQQVGQITDEAPVAVNVEGIDELAEGICEHG